MKRSGALSIGGLRDSGIESLAVAAAAVLIGSSVALHPVDSLDELAASLLESCGNRFQRSASVANAKRLVYLKLMEKHQNTDPFKFIIYSGRIGEQTPQMAGRK